METMLTLGAPAVTRYGLCCAVAVLATLVLGCVLRSKRTSSPDKWLAAALIIIPCVWLSSRVVYVLLDYLQSLTESSLYLDEYMNAALGLRFWDGGYCMSGAILGGLLGAWLAEKCLHLPAYSLRDPLAAAMPLGILIERLAEPGTGLGEGRYADSASWLAMTGSDGEAVYPVWAFEAAVALILLIVLIWHRVRHHAPKGDCMLLFLTLYGLTQVLMESLRWDQFMVMHFVRQQQVISILFVAFAMAFWTKRSSLKPGIRLCLWLLTAAAIGVAILAEFGIDRWGKPLLTYGMLIGSLLVIGAAALMLRRSALTAKKDQPLSD